MSDFRTPVSHTPSNPKIGLKTPILTLGSCFADAIGSRLKSAKIFSEVNPFGTIFSPDAIHKLLKYGVNNTSLPETSIVEHQGVFLCQDVHSVFSSSNKDDLKSKIQARIQSIHHFLKSAQWVMITYGTAWVYERKETGELVANCHKLPAIQFSKSLLTQKKIIESFETAYQLLKQLNPNINIILTVSPVRHIKDTLELNSVSKAVLRVACHTLSTAFKDVQYFPAYEIMMDDLRDYRFYKSDMLHPSEEAENYIWDKFIGTYADNNLKEFLPKWKEIMSALSHKSFHPETKAHQHFLSELLKKVQALGGVVDTSAEVNLIKQQLINP